MDKITSQDDLKIYNDDNNFRIFAGPGAGKTHLVIENIKLIIKNSKKLKFNNQRKILCITYTNAAVDEIIRRLGPFSKFVVVSTIHSFINDYIISPFQKQLKLQIQKEFNINIPKKATLSSVQEGFTVLSGHKKEDIYKWIKTKYPEINEKMYSDISRMKMADISVDISDINKYSFNENAKVCIKQINSNQNISNIIKEYIWCVAKKLSFDEILYFGFSLLKNYPIVSYILRAEFPYILLDEYQDTNPIQNKIISMISEKECSIMVVGDIAQSIYSFQGAKYQEFQNFQIASPLNTITKAIEDNRRCNINIINLLNFLRQTDTAFQQKCIQNKNTDKVTFIIQKNNTISKSIYEIIPNNTQILCRKWTEAFNYISNVSDEQKRLINSIYNAYTYSIKKDLSKEIELRKDLWINSTLDIASLQEAYEKKNLPKALNIFEKYLDIKDLFKNFDANKMADLSDIINLWRDIFSSNIENCLLKNLIKDINVRLDQLQNINILKKFEYPQSPNDESYFDEIYKYIDCITYSCAKKIVLDLFSPSSKHMTIHKAKGKEFDNVLVNLEPFSRGEERNITPSNVFILPQIVGDSCYNEYTRIAYVGCSRAKNKLYIHIKGNEQTEEAIRKSLNNYYSNNPEKQNFFDFIYC